MVLVSRVLGGGGGIAFVRRENVKNFQKQTKFVVVWGGGGGGGFKT